MHQKANRASGGIPGAAGNNTSAVSDVVTNSNPSTKPVQVAPGGPLNRHDRRKLRAGIRAFHKSARGIVEVETVRTVDIPAHPQKEKLLEATLWWASTISAVHPLCLACDHEWQTVEQRPPAAFVFSRPWQQTAVSWLVSALCDECNQHPERTTAALKRLWPGMRVLDTPHAATGGVQ